MIQTQQRPWWQQQPEGMPLPPGTEQPPQLSAPALSRFDMPDQPQPQAMPDMPTPAPQAPPVQLAANAMPDMPGAAPEPEPTPAAPTPEPTAPPVAEPDPNAIGRDPVRRARMIGALEGKDEIQKPTSGIGQGPAQQARDRAIAKYVAAHEKPSSKWDIARQVLGTAMSISPRLQGVGKTLIHPPNKTEESIRVLEDAAKQEEQQQQAISGEELKREQIEANRAWREASVAQRNASLKPGQTISDRIREATAAIGPDGKPIFTPEEIKFIGAGWKPPQEKADKFAAVAPGAPILNTGTGELTPGLGEAPDKSAALDAPTRTAIASFGGDPKKPEDVARGRKLVQDDAVRIAQEKRPPSGEASSGTWAIQEDKEGNPVLFNSKTGETKAPPQGLQKTGTSAKAAAAKEKLEGPVRDALGYASDYLANGAFTGAGDEALQEKFFELAKPASGFRMSKPQMDMLQNSRSWMASAAARFRHATTGTWFTDEQRKQIVDTMKQLAAAKLRTAPQAGSATTARPLADPLGIR